jgi:vanillate O-demethylase ferredoxin subunit
MADNTPFEVEVKSTGKTFKIPADKSILQVLNENGVYVASSCEDGVCGTCVTGVVSGTPEHRDDFQSDDEKAANNQINVCVSRAKSPKLVLDL